MKCFYHSSDADGCSSGALVKIYHPDCEMIGITYGEDFPWDIITDKDETIYMVDFSLQPFNDMIRLNELCNLYWIDHHKTAIEEYEKNAIIPIKGSRQIGTGACALVYKLFNNKEILPTFISLLSEYDVWYHSDPRTLPFQYGIKRYNTDPNNIDFWCSLFDTELVQRIVEEGFIIIEYQQEKDEKFIKKYSFETELDGYRCIAVNKMNTSSLLFKSIWDPDKYDIMLTFGYFNKQWTVSLYTDKKNIDVSKIAKKMGGGGHAQASGFSIKELPFKLK